MSIEQVRSEFDIPRLNAFNKYTEQFPPQHILVASYFGFGKQKVKIETSEDEIAELLSKIPMVNR